MVYVRPDKSVSHPEPVTPTSQVKPPTPEPSPSKRIPVPIEEQEIDQAELERVFMLGQAGDLSSLIEILKTGPIPVKL